MFRQPAGILIGLPVLLLVHSCHHKPVLASAETATDSYLQNGDAIKHNIGDIPGDY
jgi:hypothetical protein